MDFAEPPEIELLREAVRGVAGDFGHEYFAECTRTETRTDALWQAVADLGFLAVHLPEAYGGGGGGITELTVVCEELAAAEPGAVELDLVLGEQRFEPGPVGPGGLAPGVDARREGGHGQMLFSSHIRGKRVPPPSERPRSTEA